MHIQNLYSLVGKFPTTSFFTIDSFRNDDDFLVSLFIFGALFFFVAAIACTVLILIFTAIIFLLVSGGVISTSILIGFQQKSASTGFKTFFILICSLGTTAVSMLAFFLINSVKEWWSNEAAIFAGLIFGIFTGWILGLMVFFAFQKITIFFRQKFKEKLQNSNTKIFQNKN